MNVPANWFQDGQHLLVLGGGVIIFAGQAVQFWRQNVGNERVRELHNIVQSNDKEILGELSAAQRSLDKVVTAIVGRVDRRKSPPGKPPIWANGGAGRRAGDAGGPPPAPA
jgi:hypothetical protein